MAAVNDNYSKLQAGYLFPEIGRRVRAFQKVHPDASVIRLGIGDVTLPLAPAIVQALHDAVEDMSKRAYGYGPECGYDFLVDAIVEHDYRARSLEIAPTRSSSQTAASKTAPTSRKSSAPIAACS